MSKSDRIGLFIAMVASATACALQIVGLVRYVNRLPDDVVGLSLYAASKKASGFFVNRCFCYTRSFQKNCTYPSDTYCFLRPTLFKSSQTGTAVRPPITPPM